MKPMIDPKRDLAGATPEMLARALLRPVNRSAPSGLRARVEPVVRDKVVVGQAATDEPRHGVPHLIDRV